MATASVNLSTAQYVRVNAGYGSLTLQAHRDSVRIALSDTRPATSNIAFHLLDGGDAPFTLPRLDTNVWALAITNRSSLISTELPSDGDASSFNSTTALLGAGETFTGEAELNDFPDIGVSCHSSSAGTLYFDFSNDGTNWNTFPVAGFNVAAGIHEFHTAVKLGRYFRARFVNSASAQTYFRLYTYYGQFRSPSAPMNQRVGLDSDANMVRPTWTWMDIARGLQGGVSTILKFGRNSAVGTSFVPVCLGGTYNTPQSTGATALRIKAGGDANDTAAGTGARVVEIEGLDENFVFVEETITTNGTLASAPTTTTFTRVFRAYVVESGTYASQSAASHAGQITIENAAGTEDWLYIDNSNFAKGQSEIGAYTIPAGKTGYVKLRDVSIDSGKTVDIIFFQRGNADETAAPYTAMRAQSVVAGVACGSIESFGLVEVPFGPYAGPTDIGFMAKVTSGTASVSVEFEIILVDE